MMLEDGRRARRLAEKSSQGWGRKKAAPPISAPAEPTIDSAAASESDPLAALLGVAADVTPTPIAAGLSADHQIAEPVAFEFAPTPAAEPTFTDLVSVITPDSTPNTGFPTEPFTAAAIAPESTPTAILPAADLGTAVSHDEAHDATMSIPVQNSAQDFPEFGGQELAVMPTTALAVLDEPAAPTAALAIPEDPPVKKPRPKQRVSIVGVLGEVFITAGVLVLAFLGWQVWLNDIIVGNEQQQVAEELSGSWDKGEGSAPAPVDRPDPGEPLVVAAPGNAVQFATLIVPRFGPQWEKPVAEGVGVHDVLTDGIGHYPGTQMPGEIGNAAFAAHRTGWGAPFGDIGNFQVGDSIYLETADGWYRYVFRSFEYVMPTGVDVLSPVPQAPDAAAADRIITLTSCNPKTTAAERIIAYGVYDTWYPRAGGPPAEIAPTVAAATAG